jgi:hypothetical protein
MRLVLAAVTMLKRLADIFLRNVCTSTNDKWDLEYAYLMNFPGYFIVGAVRVNRTKNASSDQLEPVLQVQKY